MLCIAWRVDADVEYQVADRFPCTQNRKKILEGGGNKEAVRHSHSPTLVIIFVSTNRAIVFVKFQTEPNVVDEMAIALNYWTKLGDA